MLARSFVLAALAGSALADLTVNTVSSLIECQPALLSWNGGTAPYFLSAIPGGDSSAAALENFPQQTGTSYTWKVDLPAGTSVTIKIVDSTGVTNYNQKVTIQKGSDESCLGSGSNSTSSSTGSDAVAAGASGASSAAGSTPSASSAATQAVAAAGSAASGASNAATSASKAASTPVSASASGASAAASTSGAALPLAVTDKATGLVAVLGALAALFL